MTALLDLLHRAGQVADDAFTSAAATMAAGGSTGITPRQRAVLTAIAAANANHSKPSQIDLVGATGVDRSTLADIVRRLVHKGLVVRVRSRTDARTYQLRLTPGGEQELAAAARAAALAEDALLAALPVKQRATFKSALYTLVDKAAA